MRRRATRALLELEGFTWGCAWLSLVLVTALFCPCLALLIWALLLKLKGQKGGGGSLGNVGRAYPRELGLDLNDLGQTGLAYLLLPSAESPLLQIGNPETYLDSFQTGSGQTGSSQKWPRFPLIDTLGEMWATCGQHVCNILQHVAARDNIWPTCGNMCASNITYCKMFGFVARLGKPRLSRPRLEAGEC